MDAAYGSHYLTWFEHARNEYLRLCGLPYTEIEERGLLLPVFESHIRHVAPARYDDLVDLHCAVTECSPATATFLFAIARDGERIATGATRHACLTADRTPTRLPDWLRGKVLRRLDVGL
jgi:acyl-CoA thioester hydrolase